LYLVEKFKKKEAALKIKKLQEKQQKEFEQKQMEKQIQMKREERLKMIRDKEDEAQRMIDEMRKRRGKKKVKIETPSKESGPKVDPNTIKFNVTE
jgi:hypothetical protein